MMMTPGSNGRQPQRLSQLIPAAPHEANGTCYLQPIAHNGDTPAVLETYTAPFSSVDIVDGWKYVPQRFWYHPLHQISPYLGRFPPALARYFICKFSQPGNIVYDPFSGSGTVALEACLLDRGALASDVFVYAQTLSRAKVCPVTPETFRTFVEHLKGETQIYLNHGLDDEPLLNDLQVYYHEDTLQQLRAVRAVLNHIAPHDPFYQAAVFVKAMLCGILHGDAEFSLSVQTKDTWSASVNYVRTYVKKHHLTYPKRDVFACLERKAKRVYNAPLPARTGVVYNQNSISDIQNEAVASESIDLIVTSPPYLSVRDYPQDNWIRVWLLGGERSTETAKMLMTGVITTYETAMRTALTEMFRVLKLNRVCVIVAGDVNRRTKQNPIYRTTQRLAHLAAEVGFNVIAIFNDDIKMSSRTSQLFNQRSHPEMIDAVPHDSVLILSKGACPIYDDVLVQYSTETGQQSLPLMTPTSTTKG